MFDDDMPLAGNFDEEQEEEEEIEKEEEVEEEEEEKKIENRYGKRTCACVWV